MYFKVTKKGTIENLLSDNDKNIKKASFGDHDRFLIRLFAMTFNVEVPFCHIVEYEDGVIRYQYFITTRTGEYPSKFYYKGLMETSSLLRQYKVFLFRHNEFYESSDGNKAFMDSTKSRFKILVVNNDSENYITYQERIDKKLQEFF